MQKYIILLLLLLIPSVIAFGYNNPYLPHINPPIIKSIVNYYGEMYVLETNYSVVTYTTTDTYVNITNMTIGELNGFTFSDARTLTTSVAGLYKIDYTVSFSGLAGSTHGFAVAVNGIKQNNTYATRKLGSTDVGNVGGTGFVRLAVNNRVNLVSADEDANLNDIMIESANLNLLRIGS